MKMLVVYWKSFSGIPPAFYCVSIAPPNTGDSRLSSDANSFNIFAGWVERLFAKSINRNQGSGLELRIPSFSYNDTYRTRV